MPDSRVPVVRIEPHEANIRNDIGDVTELAASIRVHGILQPLVVCPHPWRPGCYQLLAGHRRLAAAKLAGLSYVPVTVRAVPAEASVVMLVENLHRENLGPVEKAEAFGGLLSQPGWSVARISRETGLAASGIYRYLDLLKLDQDSLERVRAGHVKVGAAIEAVRGTQPAGRPRTGSAPPRRRVTVQAEHFSEAHPLADQARIRCELAGHEAPKYGKLHGRVASLACGACWEQVIREDDRSGGKLAAEGRKPEARTAAARENMAALDGVRFREVGEPPTPGTMTAAEAAAQLGVTPRTVQRYKDQLRSQAAVS